MATRNDVTGDEIKSRVLSKQGRDNWDNIFPPKKSALDWLKGRSYKMLDPDGWRWNDGVTLETKITEAEFNRRIVHCTLTGLCIDSV